VNENDDSGVLKGCIANSVSESILPGIVRLCFRVSGGDAEHTIDESRPVKPVTGQMYLYPVLADAPKLSSTGRRAETIAASRSSTIAAVGRAGS
jgi:hypothetical protein